MSLRIACRTDLSLLELRRLHDRGIYVIKTPHVGNFYPNNLAVALLGILMLCVDRTIGGRDKNFHPHCVIHGGQSHLVAPNHTLTTHTRVEWEPPVFPERFPKRSSVCDGHLTALRDSMPTARIESESEHLTRHGERVLLFLEALTRHNPGAWHRFVRADGVVLRRTPPANWGMIRAEGIHGLELKGGEGWIIPNAWAILWDVVLGTSGGNTELFELSGPDMVEYVGRLAHDLDRAYDALRESLRSWQLPEQATLNIVPVADMRLAVAENRRRALETLVDAYLRFVRLRAEWSEQIRASDGERRAVISKVILERSAEIERLRELVVGMPEIFYRIEDASFLSQYDLLTGTRLFVHPWGLEAKISDAQEMFQLFRLLRRGAH